MESANRWASALFFMTLELLCSRPVTVWRDLLTLGRPPFWRVGYYVSARMLPLPPTSRLNDRYSLSFAFPKRSPGLSLKFVERATAVVLYESCMEYGLYGRMTLRFALPP